MNGFLLALLIIAVALFGWIIASMLSRIDDRLAEITRALREPK